MRLGQLSRKLQVKTSEIIDILQSNFDIVITNHPNSKVPEEVVHELETLLQHTTSADEEKEPATGEGNSEPNYEAATLSIEKEVTPIEPVETEPEKVTTPPFQEAIQSEEITPAEDVLTEADLNIVDGIIKAPKVEVAGIKVVGKIELPEKKVEVIEDKNVELNTEQPEPASEGKEDTNTPISTVSSELQSRPRKRTSDRKQTERRNRPKRTEKVVLTPEEERRIQLKEAQKKKIAEQQAKKEQRRKTYNEELKSAKKAPVSTKKKKTASTKPSKKSKPTSLWGRFVHWLND